MLKYLKSVEYLFADCRTTTSVCTVCNPQVSIANFRFRCEVPLGILPLKSSALHGEKYRCRKINREQFCAWLFLHYQPGLIWTKAPSFFTQKGIRSCTTKTLVISKNTLADFHAAVNFLTGIF